MESSVDLTIPTRPGTYYVTFAFALEVGGDHVASGTNWATGENLWGDGNDIAEFSTFQISQAQKFGCVGDEWLVGASGGGLTWAPEFVPSAAITIIVVNGPSS